MKIINIFQINYHTKEKYICQNCFSYTIPEFNDKLNILKNYSDSNSNSNSKNNYNTQQNTELNLMKYHLKMLSVRSTIT